MRECPPVGSTVTVDSGGIERDNEPLFYIGTVDRHDSMAGLFWLCVEKVNGEPKEPDTYLRPIVFDVRSITDERP